MYFTKQQLGSEWRYNIESMEYCFHLPVLPYSMARASIMQPQRPVYSACIEQQSHNKSNTVTTMHLHFARRFIAKITPWYPRNRININFLGLYSLASGYHTQLINFPFHSPHLISMLHRLHFPSKHIEVITHVDRKTFKYQVSNFTTEKTRNPN